jgi:hypothetical protein
MTINDKIAPVTIGEFSDGPEVMLWNPELSPARWSREVLRAFFSGGVVRTGICGAVLVVLGISFAVDGAAPVFISVGVIITCCGAIAGLVNISCFATDHRHDASSGPCHLEGKPGEFFFRVRDFTSMGPSVGDVAEQLIGAVATLHATPARAWLDPDLPYTAHRLAWDALRRLDRTREIRSLAVGLASGSDQVTLVETVDRSVAMSDQWLAEVAWHLTGCAVLAREWSEKLDAMEMRAYVEEELESLRAVRHGDDLAAASETLLQKAYGHVTAARDLTHAGPFPWEQARSAWHNDTSTPHRPAPILLRLGIRHS